MSLIGYRRAVPTDTNRVVAGLFTELFKEYGSFPTPEKLKKILDLAAIEHEDGSKAALPQLAGYLSELREKARLPPTTPVVQNLLNLPVPNDGNPNILPIHRATYHTVMSPFKVEKHKLSPLHLRNRDVDRSGLIYGQGTVILMKE